ncbi:MAG: Trm112 family protein [Paracoccus sp. (in: a-proteobacteria)]
MTDDIAASPPGFDRHMLEALVCPVTHATLHYDAARQDLVSRAAGLAFPIRQGIPNMLVDEARPLAAGEDRPRD